MNLIEHSVHSATREVPRPVVFVVDDDICVREGLRSLISSAGWLVETCSSAEEFLSRGRPTSPSCLLLDLALPGQTGLDLQNRIADRIEMPIIFMSGFGDVPTTVKAMKAGAVEFLTKPFCATAVLQVIEQALDRSRETLIRLTARRELERRYVSLSHREREVMALVALGKLNKQVGADLGISEITVKAHRGRMMRKMGVRTLAHLMNIIESLKPMLTSGSISTRAHDHSGWPSLN
jgi:FixJ family two-component response regulator